jgi:hypothetical protein
VSNGFFSSRTAHHQLGMATAEQETAWRRLWYSRHMTNSTPAEKIAALKVAYAVVPGRAVVHAGPCAASGRAAYYNSSRGKEPSASELGVLQWVARSCRVAAFAARKAR